MHRLSFSSCLASALAMTLAGCAGSSVLGPVVSRQAPASAGSGSGRLLTGPLSATSIVAGALSVATRSFCQTPADSSRAGCLGSVRVFAAATSSNGPVGGFVPSDLASLYGYPAPGAQGSAARTVGIVVAYDAPSVESDLGIYRSQFNLTPCTTANGCLRKVGAAAPTATTGTSTAVAAASARLPGSVSANPTTNYTGWAAEADTDVEAISAVCSNCKIVLAEAASDQLADLGAAMTAAVNAGATIINASFGANESADQAQYQAAFENSRARLFAAAGDSGPQVLFPAADPNAIAVAGTTVQVNGNTVSESKWGGSGGGCSSFFARPAWQSSASCANRNVADLATVGDPNTGIAFYDAAVGGWGIVGGTSVSTPIVAAMFALSGDTSAQPGAQPLYGKQQYYAGVVNGGTITGLGIPTGLGAL